VPGWSVGMQRKFPEKISADKKESRKFFLSTQRESQKYFFRKMIFPENIFHVPENFRKTFVKNFQKHAITNFIIRHDLNSG